LCHRKKKTYSSVDTVFKLKALIKRGDYAGHQLTGVEGGDVTVGCNYLGVWYRSDPLSAIRE
jgi:hypothetical protein